MDPATRFLFPTTTTDQVYFVLIIYNQFVAINYLTRRWIMIAKIPSFICWNFKTASFFFHNYFQISSTSKKQIFFLCLSIPLFLVSETPLFDFWNVNDSIIVCFCNAWITAPELSLLPSFNTIISNPVWFWFNTGLNSLFNKVFSIINRNDNW